VWEGVGAEPSAVIGLAGIRRWRSAWAIGPDSGERARDVIDNGALRVVRLAWLPDRDVPVATNDLRRVPAPVERTLLN
jgi:hypothetical protein